MKKIFVLIFFSYFLCLSANAWDDPFTSKVNEGAIGSWDDPFTSSINEGAVGSWDDPFTSGINEGAVGIKTYYDIARNAYMEGLTAGLNRE